MKPKKVALSVRFKDGEIVSDVNNFDAYTDILKHIELKHMTDLAIEMRFSRMKIFSSIMVPLTFLAFATSAETHSSIQDAFSKDGKSSSIGRYNSDFLRTFVGDTIVFNFSNQYIDYFTVETPDTVWLKKRPKRILRKGGIIS